MPIRTRAGPGGVSTLSRRARARWACVSSSPGPARSRASGQVSTLVRLLNYLQPDFDGLVSAFTDIVNKTCKEEITTKSKRNPVDNPWITQGIIISVNKKHDLYKSWQKTIKKKKILMTKVTLSTTIDILTIVNS